MLGSVFRFFQLTVFAELKGNYCPIGGSNALHLPISSAKTAVCEKLKTDPNMSGGGLEMIHEIINSFGDREIGALVGGQLPHFSWEGSMGYDKGPLFFTFLFFSFLITSIKFVKY